MNNESYIGRKVDDNLKFHSKINGKPGLPSVAEVECAKIPSVSSEVSNSEPITSQPRLHFEDNVECISCNNSVTSRSLIQNEQCGLDETLTEDVSPILENGGSFRGSTSASYGGLTNHAFIEEDSVTPRPHKMNYTCAHPQACAKCTNTSLVQNSSEENRISKELDSTHFPQLIDHQVTIVTKSSTTSAPGKALRKLDPRKLNLTLDLFSSRNKKKDKNKSLSSSNNSSLSPKSTSPFSATTNTTCDITSESLTNQKLTTPGSSHKSTALIKLSSQIQPAESKAAPKTSWLLRLFESQVRVLFAFF